MPGDTPYTTPPIAVTVATPIAALLHVPGVVASVSVVVCPWHTCSVPDIGAGIEFTVTTAVTLHPVPSVYVTSHVPAATPVTAPVVAFTVATVAQLIAQVPPGVEVVSEEVDPSQTCRDPLIADGNAYTVAICVTRQPVGSV